MKPWVPEMCFFFNGFTGEFTWGAFMDMRKPNGDLYAVRVTAKTEAEAHRLIMVNANHRYRSFMERPQ